MNLNKILFSSLLLASSLGALAIPAKPGVRKYIQKDGSEITLRLVGDENFHSLVTTDGFTVARAADGYFYYRSASGLSSVKAHNPEMRSSEELEFLKASSADFTLQSLFNERKAADIKRKAPSADTRSLVGTQVPNHGSPRVPVLLVEYADKKFKDADPVKAFEGFFKTDEKSALKYFVDQSNGKFTPQFDIYGPYTLSQERAYYGANDELGNDLRLGAMVAEGALGLDAKIDYSKYDNDGDGVCDVLIILYAGDGEASSNDWDAENAVWPCQWSLSASDYRKSLTLDGIKVDKFGCFNELNGEKLTQIDGIGTFCHEFSHCLGLPDFYDTGYSGFFGMGPWSLMDSGSYNDNTYTPCGYSAYEKEFMGWIDIEEGTPDTKYILPVFNRDGIDGDKAVRLSSDSDPNEYFILENRRKQGWDSYMRNEGLFIYHVTYDRMAWLSNSVNDFSLQRMTPVPADNSLKMIKYSSGGYIFYEFSEPDLIGDLWPYKGVKDFTDTSTPAASLNGGGFLGKPVTNITSNADGTLSFWLMRADSGILTTPENLSHNVSSATSATISWESPYTSDATFSLEIREHDDNVAELISNTSFATNDHGWDKEGYAEVENSGTGQALRLGSAKQTGSVTSPAFEGGSSDLITVKLKAKAYPGDESSVSVALLDAEGEVLDETSIPLNTDFQTEYAVLVGNAGEEMKVKLSSVENRKRVYVASVEIYSGNASEEATRAGATDVRLIEGIQDHFYAFSDLKEGLKYDYRVKAVPVDKYDFTESAWSDRFTLDLTDINGAGIEVIEEVDSPAEYFNLQGLPISEPLLPGIYIKRWKGKTTKIRI